MDTNRLRLGMVDNWPSTVKPMTSITSEGLTLPRAPGRSADEHHGHDDRDQHHQGRTEAAGQFRRMDESNNIGATEKADYEL